jgi:mono/diheme cytochrome c family protein
MLFREEAMSGRTLALAGMLAALLFATGGVRAVEPQAPVPAAGSAAAASRTLLNQYCTACHNDRTKAGGLILDGVDLGRVGENAELWEKVVRKLRMRAMPPAGSQRPDDRSYDQLVSYLETELDRRAAAAPNPGRTDTFRRLTRTEYQNAIRDLLAVDVDVADLLPRDDAGFGFDNVGAVGLSPTLVERYLSAAQKVTRLAVGTPVPTPALRVVTLPPDVTQEGHVDGLPFGTRGGTIVAHTFPRGGEYEVRVRLMRNRNENVEGLTEPHQLEVTLDGERLQLFTVTPNRNRSA